MKKIFFLLWVTGTSITSFAQNNPPSTGGEKRYIEATGSAEIEIVPDEIYIRVTLAEHAEPSFEASLETQEDNLKKGLAAAGIDLQNLSLSNANSYYESYYFYWRKKDVLRIKSYQLKVSSADETGRAFKVFGDIHAYDAYISKVSHSKLDAYKKDLEIKAVKAAKEKATYMLAALEEEVGKPVDVRENSNNFNQNYYPRYNNYYASESLKAKEGGGNNNGEDADVQFEKIKLKCEVNVKFAIKNN